MPLSSTSTRSRLIDAGAALFAERGIDNVSLREITRTAGARNTVALQHHFGDRDGLLEAIIAKHLPGVDARRHDQLDAIPARPRDARALAAALVLPLAACLDDDDGGAAFVRISADLLNRPRPLLRPLWSERSSMLRWREAVDPLLPPGGARAHRRFAAGLHTCVELARCTGPGWNAEPALVVPATVDIVSAILTSPVSRETKRALKRHDEPIVSI